MLPEAPIGADFIVSELLSELKAENSRKEHQIHRLNKTLVATILAALVSIMLVVAGFLWYLNQYDFSATTTESITNSAEGVYAIVDSNGNVISSDLTAEEIESLLEGVTVDGESD
jgi:hypothetical protein